MTTTVPANTGDCNNKAVEPFILFNVHSSKYSITPQLVEIGLIYNWFNRLGYNSQTNLNQLYVVQSSFSTLRVQSKPVAVAVAPDQGPKTRLNWTFKHYSCLWVGPLLCPWVLSVVGAGHCQLWVMGSCFVCG